MAWTLKTKENKYVVATETITSYESRAVLSSEIDFIAPGTDFQVVANTASTNLSASAHVEMHVAYESGGTYYRVNKAGFNATTGAIDAAAPILQWNANKFRTTSHGEFPYRKIKITDGGGSVTLAIIVPADSFVGKLG